MKIQNINTYTSYNKYKLLPSATSTSVNFKSFTYNPQKKISLDNLNPLVIYFNKIFGRTLEASRKRIQKPISELAPYIKEITLGTTKESKTYAWDINKGNRSKYVIALHGMSHNISNLQTLYKEILERTPYAVLAPEYRGFGKNPPTALSSKTFLQDTQNALNYLTSEKHINPENIHLLGHSFGGFTASQLAQKNPELEGLILVSSIDSLEHESVNTKTTFGNNVPNFVNFMFQNLKFLRTPFTKIFKTNECIKNLNLPIDIIHSKNDRLVKCSASKNLASQCKNLRSINILESGGHSVDSEKINTIISLLSK